MEKNVNAPENLKVKLSQFKSPLTFNEWAEKYNVSRQYAEPTQYFKGNPSAGITPKFEVEESLLKQGLRNLATNLLSIFNW
jgi:hypothetical protein